MENESAEQIQRAGGEKLGFTPNEKLPIEDYDSLTVEQVVNRLDTLSREEVEQVKSYEREHKNRKTLLEQLEKRVAAGEFFRGEDVIGWFAAYRNWILAGLGAAALVWLLL
ncbi:MAG: hypothetical protein ACP5SH_27620 [Syntrophobacteraceae bacterium]